MSPFIAALLTASFGALLGLALLQRLLSWVFRVFDWTRL